MSYRHKVFVSFYRALDILLFNIARKLGCCAWHIKITYWGFRKSFMKHLRLFIFHTDLLSCRSLKLCFRQSLFPYFLINSGVSWVLFYLLPSFNLFLLMTYLASSLFHTHAVDQGCDAGKYFYRFLHRFQPKKFEAPKLQLLNSGNNSAIHYAFHL